MEEENNESRIDEEEFRRRYNELVHRLEVADESLRKDLTLLNVYGKLMDRVRRLYRDCRGQYGTEEEWAHLNKTLHKVSEKTNQDSRGEQYALMAA